MKSVVVLYSLPFPPYIFNVILTNYCLCTYFREIYSCSDALDSIFDGYGSNEYVVDPMGNCPAHAS